ncbi:uncharacterized protein ACB058_004966 [Synchiropus picturatus]
MEVSSFSVSPEKYWTEDKERVLIAFFSEHSCLWKHKTLDYKNRELRWKTLEKLRILLSTHPPPAPFTVEDIKNKFRNLRTTFQRQYKIVQASKLCGSDDVYVPQWRHYQQLLFLESDNEGTPSFQPPDNQMVVPTTAPIYSLLPSPSCASDSNCNMVAKSLWTEEKERELIDFYCENECLWNKRSENHCNQQVRMKLLETLSAQLSDQATFLSVEDVKNKFKNLRTVFNREYKLVQGSKASSRPFNSKWKYYQEMLFLTECGDAEEGLDILRRFLPRDNIESESGNHVPTSASSSLFSSSAKSKSLNTSSSQHSEILTNSPSSYQVILPDPSDDLKAESQVTPVTLPSSRPSSPPDIKPFITPPHLQISTSSPSLSASSAQANIIKLSTSCAQNGIISDTAHRRFISDSPSPVSASTLPSTSSPPDSLRYSNPPPLQISAQPESRPLTESHCFWTDVKTHQLITFFAEHSCLWNHKSDGYKNRSLKKSLLDRLSNMLTTNEAVPFTVEDIKAKFRNLRTIFQREHKAMSSNKTCGSEDFYVPKWKHYRELMFLCDSCDEEGTGEELPFQVLHESNPLHLKTQSSRPYHNLTTTASQTVAKLYHTTHTIEPPHSPTPPDSQRSSPLSSPCTESSRVESRGSRVQRKRTSQQLTPEVLDLMKAYCQNQVTSPHTGFLKYVEECLNETPAHKVKRLKKKIIETIYSELEDAYQ